MDAVNAAAAAQFGIVAIGSLLMLLAGLELVEWFKNRSVAQPLRQRSRIPEREMQLVGEDWRTHTADYVRKHSRRSQIISEVCSERH